MKKLIIAVDFDGTIVEHAFPEIGKPLPGAFEVMKKLKDAGHYLILWTAREDEGYNINKRYLTDAVNFCKENGIEFDGINETPLELDWRETGLRRKVHCHVFIDDRNIGGFVGWDFVEKTILG